MKGSPSISPGRPPRATEVEYHDALIGQVTLDVWNGIVRRAIVDALKGERSAREFIASYTIGKPPSVLELRAADASLLAQLLKVFESRGMSASEVFGEMLATFAEADQEAGDRAAA